jgi:hypothetical protein
MLSYNIIPDIITNTIDIYDTSQSSTTFHKEHEKIDLRYFFDRAPAIPCENEQLLSISIVVAMFYDFLYARYKIEFLYDTKEIYENMKNKIFSILDILNVIKYTLKSPYLSFTYYYVSKEIHDLQQAICEHQCVLCNLTFFSNIHPSKQNQVIELPTLTDECLGMSIVLLLGYTEDAFIARIPFEGPLVMYAYIPYDYFERFNRDRWVLRIHEFSLMKPSFTTPEIETHAQDIYRFRIII